MARTPKSHGYSAAELAMRVLQFCENRAQRNWLLADFAVAIAQEFKLSRAQSYRLARLGTDIARIDLPKGPKRHDILSDRNSEARMRGWANAKAAR